MFFSSTKSENRRAEQVLPGGRVEGVGISGKEKGQEDEYGTNNVYTYK
jgi:hypothetical protein